MIAKHTLETLEYPKMRAIVCGKCLTPFGREEAEKINPMFNVGIIKQRLDEVSQIKDIIIFGDPFPLVRMEDCREALTRTKTEGIFLESADIRIINDLIAISIDLHRYDKEQRTKNPFIGDYLDQLRSFPELKKEIDRTFDEDGEIRDNASPTLKKIRNEMGDSRRKIIARLEKIISSQTGKSGWQDDIVTIRNDRYVIPIASGNYNNEIGILHDRSQSGATMYVEPQETVELNNRIHMLFREERIEIDRILRAITNEISQRSEPLLENCRIIGVIDALHASALFSKDISGNQPEVSNEASFNFQDLRHPLLIKQLGSIEKVIPNSLYLDSARQAILVTGPNTGGKTISLKAVGLSQLMAQSGLHISASQFSTVGIFDSMYADIGDEQSIELSLSTYSSHIKNIIEGIQNASDKTLLLFDEIGVGTDPKEGAALAESIILHVLNKGARMIVTTHYSQLKTLATEHPEIENGSMEFDRETLSPTYRMQIGMPGSSYAVEIAGRLGMPEKICENSMNLLGSGERSLTELIATLEAELLQVRTDHKDLQLRLERVKELELFCTTEKERLEKESDVVKKQALEDTEQFLTETRQDIERMVAEIRESQASKDSLSAFHKKLQTSSKKIKERLKEKKVEPVELDTFEIGDRVEVLSLQQKGDIDSLIGKDRAKVRIGSMLTTVEIRNLRKLDPTSKKKLSPVRIQLDAASVESNEIHLRGMTVDEAMDNLEIFLGRAVIAGLPNIYVIHGKGTGTLRRTLTQFLKSHRDVDSVRLGDWNEGGAGVSVVKLKK